jgi:hypothetical protein
MIKQEYNLGSKFRAFFDITTLKSFTGLKALLTIQEHYLVFKITDYSKFNNETKEKNFDIFYNLLKPIYVEADDNIFINYGIIKSVQFVDLKIRLEIYNPAYLTTINVILYNIESVGLIMNKTLNKDGLTKLYSFFTTRMHIETKVLIDQFLLFFNMLRSEVDPNVIRYIHEDRFYRAIFESKKYYEKSINELKKQDKLKISVNKKILLNTRIKYNNDLTVPQRDLSGNIVNYSDIETTLNDYFYHDFEALFNDIKVKASKMIDETIIIFLHISTLEADLINLKKINKVKVADQLRTINNEDNQNCKSASNDLFSLKSSSSKKIRTNKGLNKSANVKTAKTEDIFAMLNKKDEYDNISSSTQTNSKKGGRKNSNDMQPETPKFCQGKKKDDGSNNMIVNNDLCITNLNEILKKIEEVKQIHAFLQPNTRENIVHNTIEIVHRKFFEIVFEEFFPKIFQYEKDKNNNLLKLDSLYSFFLNLRGLKNFLFTDENKIHFANILFLE